MSTQYEYKTGHLSKEILESDYDSLKSIRKIAKKYNVHHSTISALFQKFKIKYQPRNRTKNETIFSEENEISFYLAGFIAADGNLYQNKDNYNISIRLGIKDENHLLLLRSLLGSNSKIGECKDHTSMIDNHIIVSSTKGFTVCSEKMYKDLNNNFLITPNKSLTLKFPHHLMHNPLIHHFIRGYFDGDGSWTIRNPTLKNKQSKINIGFDVLGTKNFIESVNNILHSALELPNNKISTHKSTYRLRFSGNRLSSIIGGWLYKDATIYLERKYNRYLLANKLLTN